MKRRPKKSQVDVALTVGAIIIPVAALFGALVFAFVMLTQFSDAARLAASISFDTITLADVAYSVPDSIRIFYKPPALCEFKEDPSTGLRDTITCLNGFLNFTNPFRFRTVAHSTEVKTGCVDTPYVLETYFPAVLPPGTTTPGGQPIETPLFISYPGHVNIKDQAVVIGGNEGTIDITLDNAIIVNKFRKSLFDTLSADISAADDPLKSIADSMLTACKTGVPSLSETRVSSTDIALPHNYAINRSGSNIILAKFNQNPLDILSDDPLFVSWSELYRIDVSTLSNRCSFGFDASFVNGVVDHTKPKGNALRVDTDIRCTSACDTNANTAICECSDGSSGTACAGQCTSLPVYITTSKLEVKPYE
jgi:hypothetical protein